MPNFNRFFAFFMRDRELNSVIAKNLVAKKELSKFITAYKTNTETTKVLKTIILMEQKLKEVS